MRQQDKVATLLNKCRIRVDAMTRLLKALKSLVTELALLLATIYGIYEFVAIHFRH